jgi:peptidoglycan/LPS O-acetylase OafA/YrhL
MTDSRAAMPGRIEVVEQLRGLAALSVVWFHFTNGNPDFLPEGALKWSGTYGWVGVEVFFVISGFIIPYSMYQRGYSAAEHYFQFLAKRLVRLEPPYVVCVLFTVFLAYVSSVLPGFRGEPPGYSGAQILLHLGYLVGFSDYAWINPVFWSLAIEFQFYLVIGLLLPVLTHRQAAVRWLSLGSLCALAVVPLSDRLLTPYLLIFALGILTFYFRLGWIRTASYLGACSLLCGAIYFMNSAVIAVASLATAISIAFIEGSGFRSLFWLGTISYSLYLIHVPIGGRIINLGERLAAGPFVRIAFLLASLVASIVAASIYFRCLERPSREWSSRVSYRRTREALAPRSGTRLVT